jgi:tetratricopeptide (TPR) repeat protein
MPYTCSTPTCAIALSKAAFPVAMNCPVCAQPLVAATPAAPMLDEADRALVDSLPYMIAQPLQRTLLEPDPWKRINLLKDTLLNYLKYLGLVTASEFFHSPFRDRGMVALFHQNLTETAFGKWNHYIRESIKYLNTQGHAWFCPDLPRYYEQVETGRKAPRHRGEIEYIDAHGDVQLKHQEATAIGMLINFRNRYLGHGLTLDNAESERLWAMYFPLFRQLLTGLDFTCHYPLLARENGQVHVLHSAAISTAGEAPAEADSIWMQDRNGQRLPVLPFFIVPGEVALGADRGARMLSYESFTGRTIKFFSPEGIERQTAGRVLERLHLLLREKEKEQPLPPEQFTRAALEQRFAEENKLLRDTLVQERKLIPGVYQSREDMEVELRSWTGAHASIFFLAAEAGSGKTNLLAEMQRQYTERGHPALLLRAGRMDRPTLWEQLAYLLNLDPALGPDAYPALAGTQDRPVFILVDGLNEAGQAAARWQELKQLATRMAPGALKWVVSVRANSKADLQPYALEDSEQELLYGARKDGEDGEAAQVHWLRPLDMAGMKGAWAHYAAADKARYAPRFGFDDLAAYDRSLYEQLGNPLVLRLFLEIYHGRPLPKKGRIHIWNERIAALGEGERTLLQALAAAVWARGSNALPLDELLQDEALRPALTSDRVDAPYARLTHQGWLSRHVRDHQVELGFTVEAALFVLMAGHLAQQPPAPADMLAHFAAGNPLRTAALEQFLANEAAAGRMDLLNALIDAGGDHLHHATAPLLEHLRVHGPQALLQALLQQPTEADWLALLNVEKRLQDLQQEAPRRDLLRASLPLAQGRTVPELRLALRALRCLEEQERKPKEQALLQHCAGVEDDELLVDVGEYLRFVGNYSEALLHHERALALRLLRHGEEHPDVATSCNQIGHVHRVLGAYNRALELYEKSLAIRLKTLGEGHSDIADSYNNIGLVHNALGAYDRALELYEKSLMIKLKTLGEGHSDIADSYNNIAMVHKALGAYDRALELYEKSLAIGLKTLGEGHPSVAIIYNNIAMVHKALGAYDRALAMYEKSLAIRLKTLGEGHPSVATSYNNIGAVHQSLGAYDRALELYEKSLAIELKTLGEGHPSVAISYNNIGQVHKALGAYDRALELYEKCLAIKLKTLGIEHPYVAKSHWNMAESHEAMGDLSKALHHYQRSATIRRNALGAEHADTIAAVDACRRVAAQLGTTDQLPAWMHAS